MEVPWDPGPSPSKKPGPWKNAGLRLVVDKDTGLPATKILLVMAVVEGEGTVGAEVVPTNVESDGTIALDKNGTKDGVRGDTVKRAPRDRPPTGMDPTTIISATVDGTS